MKVQNFEQLIVWKVGVDITLDIYRLTRNFPREEKYGLVSQIRRAAVSIPSNIAEGFNRRQTQDFRRFLQIALGSAGELETQIIISCQLGFIAETETIEIRSKVTEEQKMLKRFVEKLSLRTEN